MSLKIYLLGQFKLQVSDQQIELPSRPAQSLLAYLVLNADVTHRREKLASLLWPDSTESNARGYLRQALWRIHKSLEGGGLDWHDYLDISDISVTFDGRADYWLDANLLLDAEEQPLEAIIETLRLYRGELLPGFYEEWVVSERDRLQVAYHQKMNLLLERLIQAERWDETLEWGEHWIRLGHAPEAAFRALIRAYAGMGDQAMVSATYQRCVEALDRELSLEPSPETTQLYDQTRRRTMQEFAVSSDAPVTADRRPAFLYKDDLLTFEKTNFVARERELSKLRNYLDPVLAGQGKVVFVTGEAGSGKTTLIQEFTQRAQETQPDLIVAGGNCNAHTGIGDPYLPFREILELLTGDVEARWAAGAINREHAYRLWNTLPLAAQELVEAGPDLIGTFIPGAALLERAIACMSGRPEWLNRLNELVERKQTGIGISSPQQSDLFEQYTRALLSLARRFPLVLVVDDLQWADLGSVSLLFHLGRRLAGSRILIISAYRPEEVALGRDGSRHPLEPVINQFQRDFGEITLDLSQAEKLGFVEALLDIEPNRLGGAFREMLYRQTRGHPLFTIELLRGLQDRGDLIQDSQACWVEGPALDWETLPARVDAVIAERMERLPQPLQAILQVASVEGEVFTAEVVARVQKADEREIVAYLSGDLDRKHGLVRAQAIERLGLRRISRYRFRNFLFQKYLYDDLDEVERAYLHEDVGNVLEEFYEDQAGEIAVQLAWHFREARIMEKAIQYLRQAGERALGLSAYQEAITHLSRELAYIEKLPESTERAQAELDSQMTLSIAWQCAKGAQANEVEVALTRARQLCRQLGKTSQLGRVMGGLTIIYYVRAEYQKARQYAEDSLSLAQQVEDVLLKMLAHWLLGLILFPLGEYVAARGHLGQVITLYDPEQHHAPSVALRGSDIGVSTLAYDALCLWCLGYPDQAMKRSQQALTLAREFDHPYTLADVLCYAGCMFHALRRDARAYLQVSEELARLVNEKGLMGWLGMATSQLGEALALLGKFEDGIPLMRQGMAIMQADELILYLTRIFSFLGEAQAKAGRLEEGIATIGIALERVEQFDERLWEAELYRVRAELLLMRDDLAAAEESYQKAIKVARQQQAKSWELRAATGLARLWQKQGRIGEARGLLGEVYHWFTEGFDTLDLKNAEALLEELS
jgi:DNA-binding SARP family transcriptional activator